MATYPQANLPNESTRWGVAMQGDMVELRREAERSAQANLNANKQNQSSMGLLSQQVKDLTAQQAELTAQNVTLAAQVATIASVVSKQVVPGSGSNAASGFSLTTSRTAFTSVTIGIPSGYSRALVFASGSLSGTSGANTGSDVLFASVTIAGELGPETPNIFATSSGANAAASSTRSLAGLSGESVVVTINGRLANGPDIAASRNLNFANVSVQAIFLQ